MLKFQWNALAEPPLSFQSSPSATVAFQPTSRVMTSLQDVVRGLPGEDGDGITGDGTLTIDAEASVATFTLGTGIDALTLGTTDLYGDYGHVFDVGTTDFGSLTIESRHSGPNGPFLYWYLNSSSPADDDAIGGFSFSGKNDAAEVTQYGSIAADSTDVSDGTEDGRLRLSVLANGAEVTALALDGSNATFAKPPVVPSYAKASLPSASPAGQMIYVTDEAGGAVIAFSDATNWRRVTDRAIVS